MRIVWDKIDCCFTASKGIVRHYIYKKRNISFYSSNSNNYEYFNILIIVYFLFNSYLLIQLLITNYMEIYNFLKNDMQTIHNAVLITFMFYFSFIIMDFIHFNNVFFARTLLREVNSLV